LCVWANLCLVRRRAHEARILLSSWTLVPVQALAQGHLLQLFRRWLRAAARRGLARCRVGLRGRRYLLRLKIAGGDAFASFYPRTQH